MSSPATLSLNCNQCEQTANGLGCSINGNNGVCGKNADVESLQQILLYGLKGMAAYAHHARRLGATDESVNAFIEESLFATMTNVNFDVPALLEMVLECGRKNLRVMQMLDEAHVRRLGAPGPTTVTEGPLAGPGILMTGHDLLDLANLLDQLAGTDIKVYTHGEMLPAHMYPKLREHPNLAGHYGGAWQKQKAEFDAFPGPIVVTTNCVVIPRPSYADRLFTLRAAAVPGGTRLEDGNFAAVIAKARDCPPLTDGPKKQSVVGFHHSTILGAAESIVASVKAGQISRFYLIGGCDGYEAGRSYYSDFANATPPDSFVLTLGCGKYRIREHDFGTHPSLGLPRLLDMGQCNDSYGAIVVASALAKAFNCSVNDLPLTIVLSWFEQKAVAVLLTLLALGVKGITIGPKAPAFISPNVFKILQEQYDLRLIGSDGAADAAATLTAKA